MASAVLPNDDSLKSQLTGLRHDDKWEFLKPVLCPMFDQSTVKEIAESLKYRFGFDANEEAYRFRFKKWGWKKNVPASVKERAIRRVQRRATLGKASAVIHKGRVIDMKKLNRQATTSLEREGTILDSSRRHVASQAAVLGDFLPFGNRIFISWNMPFGLSILQQGGPVAETSPGSQNGTSPSSIQVLTPEDRTSPPANRVSLDNYIDPRSRAMQRRSAHERANLLLSGRFDEAVNSMNDVEKALTSKWLYQYWHFSFVTAKYWGSGIRSWSSADLQFDEFDQMSFRSVVASPAPLIEFQDLSTIAQVIAEPDRFCRYAIHVVHEIMDDESDDDVGTFVNGELNARWPNETPSQKFEDRLCQALTNNNFSNIPADSLPIAVDHMAQIAQNSSTELMAESLTFAIMARNFDLVKEIFDRAIRQQIDLSSTYYLHVATSYLEGASTCCMILDYCCFRHQGSRQAIYINEYGHTVLDNLVLTILKGHSRASPVLLDETLKRHPRFPGVEIDLCGRWDADSYCYRSLLQAGKTEVPFQWKHKFCHSSAQAVWHCIVSLSDTGFPLATNSGLFIKHCTVCGQKLQLGPLHALTLAAFRLAQDGCEDEDLFGMCAVLTCLISCGLKGYETSHVSVPLIFGEDASEKCSHAVVTPLQLAESLPLPIIEAWPEMKQVGWRIFCHILRLAIKMHERPLDLPSYDEFGDSFTSIFLGFTANTSDHIERFLAPCGERCDVGQGELCFEYSNQLGHLWATFQAELLMYRKQSEDDPWVSDHFDMKGLLASLEAGSRISIPLLRDDLVRPYCRCGIPEDAVFSLPPRRDQLLSSFVGNMDIWERSTFLDVPPRTREYVYQ